MEEVGFESRESGSRVHSLKPLCYTALTYRSLYSECPSPSAPLWTPIHLSRMNLNVSFLNCKAVPQQN